MFRPTVRYETGSCKIVQYSPNFRSTLDYPSINSSEAKEREAFRKATSSPHTHSIKAKERGTFRKATSSPHTHLIEAKERGAFRKATPSPPIHSSEAKRDAPLRKATPSPRIDLFASPSHPSTYVPDYLAVTVAAVLLVMTVGLMKNTSLTLISHAVGLAVPDLTVILPLPRFGAVRRPREFETLLANLYVQIASPEVLQRV